MEKIYVNGRPVRPDGTFKKPTRLEISQRPRDFYIHRSLEQILYLRAKGYIRKMNFERSSSKECTSFLGVPIETVKIYIERKFTEGMNWNNHGRETFKKGKEWQIDHIVPLCSAKTKEDLILLLHYTNLQPLWSIDNWKKHGKILPTQLILTI